ncbi:hypothetical protein BV25DRAFT_1852313 [Artomyces pyxidatus]|uniref:Uncharacterized protein n=1 Tax=Artomyces pyxidatus TaxID=48021 RepID=A0ACB8T6X0_9AGAM|nr:hypothetical protein BV25DRAFT_1852313 [Artomyces pyxidatus]
MPNSHGPILQMSRELSLDFPVDVDLSSRRRNEYIWDEVLKRATGRRSARPGTSTASPALQGHKRVVLRQWPRSPSGPFIKDTPPGKQAGNGLPLWGASMMDFYRVQRFPLMSGASTISTGSKLAAWAYDVGELDAARPEITWADNEEDPVELQPFDIGKLIEALENTKASDVHAIEEIEATEIKVRRAIIVVACHSLCGIKSTFNKRVPFTEAVPLLKKRIPYNLLPQKLVVHDPDCTLFAADDGDVPNRPADLVRTYKLQLTAPGQATLKADSMEAIVKAPEVEETYVMAEIRKSGGATEQICVVYPLPPDVEEVQEAHLYLSSTERLGNGNHSVVYTSELEVPRALLVAPTPCHDCIVAGIKKQLNRGKAPSADPSPSSRPAATDCPEVVILPDGELPDAPVRMLEVAEVGWRGSARAPCKHAGAFAPPTATVRVAAKLSLPEDEHLVAEAANYQRFPRHLFQYWSGFNIIPPLHDPVPVHAVVPQFYGYYVPESLQAALGEDAPPEYLSPIMLLEDCGTPIDPTTLNLDDRSECASLLFRLHSAGFTHGSVFERNIVMQLGDIEDDPRKKTQDRRFRLIDFGRTTEVNRSERLSEETRVAELMKVLYGNHWQ